MFGFINRVDKVDWPPRDLSADVSSFIPSSDRQILAGGMPNPPPAPPHQDGSHGLGFTPFEQLFV